MHHGLSRKLTFVRVLKKDVEVRPQRIAQRRRHAAHIVIVARVRHVHVRVRAERVGQQRDVLDRDAALERKGSV
jgi:hypothetical protein